MTSLAQRDMHTDSFFPPAACPPFFLVFGGQGNAWYIRFQYNRTEIEAEVDYDEAASLLREWMEGRCSDTKLYQCAGSRCLDDAPVALDESQFFSDFEASELRPLWRFLLIPTGMSWSLTIQNGINSIESTVDHDRAHQMLSMMMITNDLLASMPASSLKAAISG